MDRARRPGRWLDRQMATAGTDTSIPGTPSGAAGDLAPLTASTVLRAVRTYFSTRFPIGSQGVTVLFGYIVGYLLYGQAYGHQVFGWPTVVGAISGVLLALVRRIVDDIEDLRKDVASGMVAGALTATAAVAILNATCSLELLAISVGLACWFPVATVTRNLIARNRRWLFFIINESCPAIGLIYPYVIWHEVSGATVPAPAVLALGALSWVSYEFWAFTRKVGAEEGWPPWGLSLTGTRTVLLIYVTLTALLSLPVAHYFHLTAAYVVYAFALALVYATVLVRWWRALPAVAPERTKSSWGGVRFAVFVQVGLLIALAVS
jgi:hypothetical protein